MCVVRQYEGSILKAFADDKKTLALCNEESKDSFYECVPDNEKKVVDLALHIYIKSHF